MSDQNDYLRTGGDRRFRLRADGLSLMLKGAGYAVGFLFGNLVWTYCARLGWQNAARAIS